MLFHLWSDNPPPWEYVELILCRDVYHCTPMELDEIPASKLMATLTMLSKENYVKNIRSKQR